MSGVSCITQLNKENEGNAMHHAVSEAMNPQDVMTGGRVKRDGEGGYSGVSICRIVPLTVFQLLSVLPLCLQQFNRQNHPCIRSV